MKRKVLVAGVSGYAERDLTRVLAREEAKLHFVLKEENQEPQSVSNIARLVVSPDLRSMTEP